MAHVGSRTLRRNGGMTTPESIDEMLVDDKLRPSTRRFTTRRFGNSLPQTLQVRRAERAIVQAVTRAPGLAPDHSPMIRPNRSAESALMECRQNRVHVDVAEPRRMWAFIELFF